MPTMWPGCAKGSLSDLEVLPQRLPIVLKIIASSTGPAKIKGHKVVNDFFYDCWRRPGVWIGWELGCRAEDCAAKGLGAGNGLGCCLRFLAGGLTPPDDPMSFVSFLFLSTFAIIHTVLPCAFVDISQCKEQSIQVSF